MKEPVKFVSGEEKDEVICEILEENIKTKDENKRLKSEMQKHGGALTGLANKK